MSGKILTLLSLTIMVFGCGDDSKKNTSFHSESSAEHNLHEKGGNEGLELNSGEKWKVNEEMIPAIQNIQNEIGNFSKGDQKNYSLLADKLQVEIGHLTSSCTMTGQSHDELHKWLLPFIDLVQELSEAKNNVQAAEIFTKIEESMELYAQYFQ